MRDLIITACILGTIPFILRTPHIGTLVWLFISIVNPHRTAWGFAYDFPFAQIIAVTTIAALVFSKQQKKFPWTGTTVTLLFFLLWMNVSTIFAWDPVDAVDKWMRTMKILFMLFLTLLVINTRERLHQMIWVIVVSLGYFGVKGGLFTAATGGSYIIYGPPSSFIESNNSLAVALIMTLPLMYYLQSYSDNKWLRRGLLIAMLLLGLAILGSHSRGAFLGAGAMLALLWWKSSRKALLGLTILATIPIALSIMPETYFSRLETIKTYEEDASAMGRINAWHFAYNVAKESPLVGGGFKVFDPKWFNIYAPNPLDFHDAHSIYFEVLGEHGFVGLSLFLLMWVLTWRTSSWIAIRTRETPEMRWAYDLSSMLQVGIFGYLVGGTFLGLAYWDVPYYYLACLVILQHIVKLQLDPANSNKPSWPHRALLGPRRRKKT